MKERRNLGQAFSALLAASFVSNLGDGMRLAALPLLATTLTSSPFLIASVTAAQYLPWAVFAPFGGVIVDRSDRRRLIMVTQAWRALVMALLALAVVTDIASIWLIMIVAFTITVGEILVDPSVVATIPRIVAPNDLDRANGRLTTVEVTTNQFVGSPVGAGAFVIVPWLPFVLDALSYFSSILPFSKLPQNEPRPTTRETSFREEMGDGLTWIREHPFLRPLTIAIAVFHLGTAGSFALLVVILDEVLEAPAWVFGFVLAGAAVGATIASLCAAALTDRYPRRAIITAASTLAAISVIAVSGVSAAWHVIVLWTLNGAAAGILLSIGRGFVQRHTANDRLGRTAVASRMITRSMFVISALGAGLVAELVSVRGAFVVSGSFHLIGAALLWRSFRHEPGA